MKDKDTIVYMEDILIDINKNCHLFRHGVNYI